MSRSVNKATILGNLTKDVDLRYTEKGSAVATVVVATNRNWTTEEGAKHEDTEFHRVIVWNKLAEIASKLLLKGSRVYFEGRIATRKYTDTKGNEVKTTEIIADDMVVLNQKKSENTEEEHESR